MKELATAITQAQRISELRCVSFEDAPNVTTGPLGVYIEHRRDDTVFKSGGLDLYPDEPYYGLHLSALGEGQSFSQTVIPALEAIAYKIGDWQTFWESKAELGPAPYYLTGVTHWGLARVAHYAGFTCTKLDPSIFNEEPNVGFGWKEYAANVEGAYQQHTDAGREGKPIPGYGLIYQPVETFIKEWTTQPSDV